MTNLIQYIKQLYTKPPAMTLAVVELEEAKRQLLLQRSAAEYHAKLAQYYEDKIERLKTYVGVEKKPIKFPGAAGSR